MAAYGYKNPPRPPPIFILFFPLFSTFSSGSFHHNLFRLFPHTIQSVLFPLDKQPTLSHIVCIEMYQLTQFYRPKAVDVIEYDRGKVELHEVVEMDPKQALDTALAIRPISNHSYAEDSDTSTHGYLLSGPCPAKLYSTPRLMASRDRFVPFWLRPVANPVLTRQPGLPLHPLGRQLLDDLKCRPELKQN